MHDQQSEMLVAPRRVRVDEPFVRPAQPDGVVSHRLRRSWTRRLAWLLLVVPMFAAGVFYFARPDGQREESGRPPAGGPVPVGASRVVKGDMPVTLSQLGTVTPLAMVTAKTQISGYLVQVGFKEGQMVNRGEFLAQIDPRPYQVALEQTGAQLAKDQALLKNARLDLQRYNTLVSQNSIAKQTRDTQVSLVAQYEATVKADQANIDAQRLNLTYCRIVSPVTGRVGLRQVDPGNYVQSSDPNGIVVVTQLQPISVIFTLPEDNLPEVMKRVRAGAVLLVTAYDRTGSTELAQGKLDTVDNQIDPTTGTVKLRAIFDNEQEALFPNQFVNVKLLVNTLHGTDTVPSSAIQRGAPGTFVYVAEPDQTVAVRKVKLGPTDGQRVATLSGLEPGENVVIDGADRLRDGAKIRVASAEGSHPDAGRRQEVGAQSRPSRTKTEPMAATLLQGAAAAEVSSTTATPPLQPAGTKEQRDTTRAPVPGPVSAIQTPPADAAEMNARQSKPQPTLLEPVVSLTEAPSAARNIAGLVTRGDAFASSGDITSARLFYERAVEEGDGRAALRMAMTFDPIVLSQIGIRATAGDSREALSWYQRARDLGQPIPEHLFEEITQQSRTPNGSGQRQRARGDQD